MTAPYSSGWNQLFHLPMIHTDGSTEHEQDLFLTSAPPYMYQVWLLYDDSTPTDFISYILEVFFHKDENSASDLVRTIYHEGQAACGCFTREVAEMKVAHVIDFARANQYPLKCVMRRDHGYVVKKS